MFSTMECQRRAAAIQTSSQLSPFTRVTLSNFFLIVISRIADGSPTSVHWEFAVTLRGTLVPVGRWVNQERPLNASTCKSGQGWIMDILKIPPISEVNLSLKCPNFYLPSFVPPNPAPPFLPIVKCQITNLEQILHRKART